VHTSDSLAPLLADLAGEHDTLDALVGPIDEASWDAPTAAAGWAVRDQIGHLTFFDGAATRALLDPAGFVAERDAIMSGTTDVIAEAEARVRRLAPVAVLAEWRFGRASLLEAAAPIDARDRIEWYGPAMSARSFVTARLMETWAHGLDVADGLGRPYPATGRLRHVAHLGVATRGWSFIVRGMAPTPGDVRVELEPPGGGEPWVWGDATSVDRVAGPALDFCLVVTQRRLLADTALEVDGPLASRWMANAQAFAGAASTTDPARKR
jgi:uncharacterized protein (TIGR03084 family)